jgi:hypothetical protein
MIRWAGNVERTGGTHAHRILVQKLQGKRFFFRYSMPLMGGGGVALQLVLVLFGISVVWEMKILVLQNTYAQQNTTC